MTAVTVPAKAPLLRVLVELPFVTGVMEGEEPVSMAVPEFGFTQDVSLPEFTKNVDDCANNPAVLLVSNATTRYGPGGTSTLGQDTLHNIA